MYLDQVDRTIQVVLTAAKTTSDMPVIASYEDSGKGAGTSVSSTNGTTAVDVVLAPESFVVRKIKSLTVHNADTASKTVKIYHNDSGTQTQICSAILGVGETLGYSEARGWYAIDANGNTKTAGSVNISSLAATGAITSSSATGGIGYATGAGAAVTQLTDRTTGVTINATCGAITTNNASLAAEASANFTVTNSAIAIGDIPVLAIRSGSNGGNTAATVVTVANGSFVIKISNNNAAAGTAETGAIVINFALIKAVSA